MIHPEQQAPLVAHVVFSLGTGGLENGMVNIINRIPQNRYRHAIVCIKQSGEFADRITAPGVEIIELNKREGHDLGLYWRLWGALLRLRPSIVHSRNIAAIEAQLVAAAIPGVKGVHGEHGRDIYDVAGENWKYRYLRRCLSPFINCFTAVSQDLAAWLSASVGIPAGKIRQIYNGVDVERFSVERSARPSNCPESFSGEGVIVVGTVGRLAPIKDQATLLRAFNNLRASVETGLAQRLRLVLVGDGPSRGALGSLLRELDLESCCWMAGNRNDIPELLGLMDVFALPSLGEGISNTILEAMATGLPIVASNVGGNPELVEEGGNGLLFPAKDVDALAAALERLCTDNELRKAMGEKSRACVVEQFSWKSTVQEYCAVYDHLLNKQQALRSA